MKNSLGFPAVMKTSLQLGNGVAVGVFVIVGVGVGGKFKMKFLEMVSE